MTASNIAGFISLLVAIFTGGLAGILFAGIALGLFLAVLLVAIFD